MKSYKILALSSLLLGSFALFTAQQAPESAEDILKKSQQALGKHTSVKYKATYRYKCYNCEDTTDVIIDCKLIRSNSDSLMNGMVSFMSADSTETLYNLKHLYVVHYKKKKAEVYNPYLYGTFALTNNPVSNVILDEFLIAPKAAPISAKSKLVLGKDASVKGKACWTVEVQLPDDPDITENKKLIYIDKLTYLPVKIAYQNKYSGSYEYDASVFDNLVFDGVKPAEFSEFKVPTRVKSTWFRPFKPLSDGTQAPNIVGKTYPNNQSFKLEDYKGKVVVLNFWHSYNQPSINAISFLNSISTSYADKGVAVVSVDTKDVAEYRQSRFAEVHKNGGIKYPVVMPDANADSAYKVKRFPTFYIINKDGQISYSQIGYARQMEDSLKQAIEQQIK